MFHPYVDSTPPLGIESAKVYCKQSILIVQHVFLAFSSSCRATTSWRPIFCGKRCFRRSIPPLLLAYINYSLVAHPFHFYPSILNHVFLYESHHCRRRHRWPDSCKQSRGWLFGQPCIICLFMTVFSKQISTMSFLNVATRWRPRSGLPLA